MPKFSEYVGESLDKLRNDIEVNREEKKRIAKLEKPKPVTETLVSFSLGKKHLKRVFDYLKSWFVRYRIPFESVNPYLTLFKVMDIGDKDEIIREVKKLDYDFFTDGKFVVLREDKDYLSLVYSMNNPFMSGLREIFEDREISILGETAYIKIIAIERDSFPLHMWKDLIYSLPKIPNIKPGGVSFLTRRV